MTPRFHKPGGDFPKDEIPVTCGSILHAALRGPVFAASVGFVAGFSHGELRTDHHGGDARCVDAKVGQRR
jgi:hypothetical protein